MRTKLTLMSLLLSSPAFSGPVVKRNAYVNCITCNEDTGKCKEQGSKTQSFDVQMRKSAEGSEVGFKQLSFVCNGQSFLGKFVIAKEAVGYTGQLSLSQPQVANYKAKTLIKGTSLDDLKSLSVILGKIPLKSSQNMDVVFGVSAKGTSNSSH